MYMVPNQIDKTERSTRTPRVLQKYEAPVTHHGNLLENTYLLAALSPDLTFS